MDKIRVEIHLTKEEGKILDEIVKTESRTRKNWCEIKIREALENYDKPKKKR